MSDSNLFAHFAKQFEARASEELLATADGTSYSYQDMDRESARLANFLLGLGIRTGDRVSVQVEKSPQALALYLALIAFTSSTVYRVSGCAPSKNSTLSKPILLIRLGR